ncbi:MULTISPECIES: sodium:proton antiporter [unclassified Microbacterium]|uniref:cation:proton antiporter n=1 Tax=unclassified Microbacterium TaxID=2609290 RepID=UPI00214CB776|nr:MULTISPECIES: sodium:proton antiporter [unclassified Microbacterium]MCR2784698.1 sodium:proton antiporter [Microbacterium sp. zg.B96]MDL5352848.1 sodium:proton antiporter [Microbacterium sp. zg-YB36]WIM16238.1 sodium:proton antiporter [Microbacterium sp. zg-B96]
MDAVIVLAILGVVVIAVATGLAPRLNIAGPLLLVIAGLGVSLLPFVPAVEVDPEIILVGILPPLLYSAAVSLPAIEFRRDFGPIAGLSVVLVVISSVVLGLFFTWAIPDLGLLQAIALGAILSPTDAVATSIVKRLGLSPRVVTMLEGESLLNDATSLVLLRTAVAAVATGGAVAAGEFAGAFAWGVLVALAVGALVGLLSLRFRTWVGHSAANTAVGFAVPFAAYLPTEHLGGSGLVAAVVAGIVTGQGSARWLTAEQRLSATLNWRTIELVLEGAVFLIMGLELKDIWRENVALHDGPLRAAWLALAALGIVLVVRTGYVALLVQLQGRRARHKQRERLDRFGARIEAIDPQQGDTGTPPHRAAFTERRIAALRRRLRRAFADLDYYQSSPLGWKHGAIIVWAGMRGVVTLAAAQTLPRDTPARELLILTAFLVAVISLLVQGFTLPAFARLLRIPPESDELTRDEQDRIDGELREAAMIALSHPDLRRRDGTPFPADLVERVGGSLADPPDEEETVAHREALELRLALIRAMRVRLVSLSNSGLSSAALRHSLAELDADELSLRLRLDDDD